MLLDFLADKYSILVIILLITMGLAVLCIKWLAIQGRALVLVLRARQLVEREKDRPSLALPLLNRAIALNPKLALAYVLRSQVFYWLGDDDAALADADRGIRLGPRDYRAYMVRAVLHDYFGDYREAVRDLESAIFYNSQWLVGYLDLALHHLALNEPEKCLTVLKALGAHANRHPLHYNALVMTGLVYEENIRDFDQAIKQYSHAIELAPNRRVAYLMRAWALRAQGEYSAAATDLLRAAKCPQPPEDKGLYGWLQAQYDPWLYLVANDPEDRNAWLAILKHSSELARVPTDKPPTNFRPPGHSRFHLN